jgi:hypothetical protein
MKWNISVIDRKKNNNNCESTGEGTCNRPKFNKILIKKIFEYITKEGISPVLIEIY